MRIYSLRVSMDWSFWDEVWRKKSMDEGMGTHSPSGLAIINREEMGVTYGRMWWQEDKSYMKMRVLFGSQEWLAFISLSRISKIWDGRILNLCSYGSKAGQSWLVWLALISFMLALLLPQRASQNNNLVSWCFANFRKLRKFMYSASINLPIWYWYVFRVARPPPWPAL